MNNSQLGAPCCPYFISEQQKYCLSCQPSLDLCEQADLEWLSLLPGGEGMCVGGRGSSHHALCALVSTQRLSTLLLSSSLPLTG